ncbi:S41 family peptidase [Aquimarina rhabdastrellae]
MKSILIKLLVFQFFISTTNSQKKEVCKCTEDFNYVVTFIENNFPGFEKNIVNEREYEHFKKQLKNQTEDIEEKNECLKKLIHYVEYFKDNHTKMRTLKSSSIDESSTASVQQFLNSKIYKQSEVILLSKKDILDEFSVNDIRGNYSSLDSTYVVTVLESKNELRDYIGVILNSKSKLWKKGQVKFEIKKKEQHVYEGIFYDKQHQVSYKTAVPFNDGFLGNYWVKTKKRNKINYSLNTDKEFKYSIKDSTVVLRIPSFMGQYTNRIDSLYKAAQYDMEQYPYLIIDIRDNGGGNSTNFNQLIPYLYTKPIINKEEVELYATKDIIKLYEDDFSKIMKDSTQVNKETIQLFREIITKLKTAKPNSFLLERETDTLVMTPKKYPRKIGLLYNRGCASACEDLLFTAMQSDKTILLGDNSGGFVGYGNVFTVYTPNYKFGLSCTTTRYRTQWIYEVIGITPEKKLDFNKSWIDQTITILKTKNN